jgi:mannose-1-phosphate guanylyltransferase
MPHSSEADIFQVRIRPNREPWAVILAGGESVRLRPLSKLISGDDRPKQFCRVFGDRSLLAHTRNRLTGMTCRDRTLFVVTSAHESFYSAELSDVSPSQIVVQPVNRGTGAAIAYALLRIVSHDPDAVVAFFPSDHYCADETRFQSTVESAVAVAGERPDSLILLGAEATHPETEYAWIEPGGVPAGDTSGLVCHVSRFWEKPSLATAESLQRQGCLWNTFVMVGRASAFFCLLQFTVPGLLQTFSTAAMQGNAADAYMWDLAPVDFSQQVLSHCTAQLLVVKMAASVGWSDLGESALALNTLAHVGVLSAGAPPVIAAA